MTSLQTTIAGITLNNPIILAAGIMDEDAESMQRIINAGAGAITTKSIGLTPNQGYPNPTLIELPHGILNAMGLPNPGIEHFQEEMNQLTQTTTPIIGSIYAATPHEFVQLAQKMQNYGAAAVELNLSCPHSQHYGHVIGSDPQLTKEITAEVKKHINIPVFVKLSPNVTDIVQLAQAAQQGNADALVAINTVKAMKINLDLRQPILSNKIGGYSGHAIKPISIRCVYEIKKHIKIPIIGVGGITTGEDAIEYLLAGASAIQIGSALHYRGIDAFTQICTEINTWLQQHNYTTLTEIIGAAHQ